MRVLLYLVTLSVIVWCIVGAALTPDTVTVSGEAWASCETLAGRPTPTVSDEDGRALGGSARMTTTPAGGRCVGRFDVSGVPERDRYTVTVGPMSAPVPRGAVATVELSGS